MRSVSLLTLALLVSLVVGYFVLKESTNEGATPGQMNAITDGNGSESPAQGSSNSSNSERGSRRSPIRNEQLSSEQTPDATPFESNDSASNMLMEVATLNGWAQSVARENIELWSKACQMVESFDPYKNMDESELNKIDPAVKLPARFSAYCEGLVDSSKNQLSDTLSRAIQRLPTEEDGASNHWTNINDVFRAENWDLARDLIINQLDQSLLKLDEVGSLEAVLQLIRPGSDLLETPFANQVEGSLNLYYFVAEAVATALICQHAGGCRGWDHPMVLRICATASEKNIGCMGPVDIFDAIYQTQTPIENDIFWSLHGQITTMLIAHRRRS